MTLMEMCLLGPTIAFDGLYYGQHGYAEMYISVMDWQRASENPPDYAWRVIDQPNCMFCKGLLQENKLLLKDWDGPKVFDWSQLEVKKAMPTLTAPMGPLLEANLNDVPRRTPGWCFDEHTSQFIYGSGLSVYSTTVEDAHSESPVSHPSVKRADGHEELDLDAHAVGRTCAAASIGDGEVWLTRYAAVSGGGSGSGSGLSPAICKGRPSSLESPISQSDLLMDEESGRVVLHGLPGTPLAVVIDFALVRKL
ncbi:hypothetical protein HYPSUDRAFT_62809 [Hypholoma sublateritium FD-334 SS-4]|uniref:Uncharacterized protein n=1 Tax=Hypholoma sublateritium (strain FD-334 SS-4) TaxID=945553 RepID=A0A0D2LJE1_HYPSF|nr:hypothetical protein HYPSUDRAFT_62809 [Hypholoma sublateritium FD-334 SS-4]